MASTTLRAYNREIEGLTDRGQMEEAVAHCMHILRSIPKHIHTYRLLGKALLEMQRYKDAVDIFQRVETRSIGLVKFPNRDNVLHTGSLDLPDSYRCLGHGTILKTAALFYI